MNWSKFFLLFFSLYSFVTHSQLEKIYHSGDSDFSGLYLNHSNRQTSMSSSPVSGYEHELYCVLADSCQHQSLIGYCIDDRFWLKFNLITKGLLKQKMQGVFHQTGLTAAQYENHYSRKKPKRDSRGF
jgi:hypothetical protein